MTFPNLFPLNRFSLGFFPKGYQLQEYIFGGNDTIDESMPFKADIEDLTLKNRDYRRVLYTTRNLQLVLMSLLPGEEIGFERHSDLTQFFRIEAGEGVIVVNKKKYIVTDGDVVVIPPNAEHNVMNISDEDRLQLYTIYSPPQHPRGTVQKVKPKD